MDYSRPGFTRVDAEVYTKLAEPELVGGKEAVEDLVPGIICDVFTGVETTTAARWEIDRLEQSGSDAEGI